MIWMNNLAKVVGNKEKWTRRDTITAVITFGLILIAIAAIIYGFVYSNSIKREIRANPVMSKGVIILRVVGRNGHSLSFEYTVDNITYRGQGGFFPKKDRFTIGDSCAIIYNKKDPSKSLLYKDKNNRITFYRKPPLSPVVQHQW